MIISCWHYKDAAFLQSDRAERVINNASAPRPPNTGSVMFLLQGGSIGMKYAGAEQTAGGAHENRIFSRPEENRAVRYGVTARRSKGEECIHYYTFYMR